MQKLSLTLTLLAVVLVSSIVPPSGARPPRPGTDENGLNESEAATLWSHDDDSQYISNEAYREAYGENRTAVHQLANGTDLTFTQPPATAARWTRADHEEFSAGQATTSVYPPHATLTNGTNWAKNNASRCSTSSRATLASCSASRSPGCSSGASSVTLSYCR